MPEQIPPSKILTDIQKVAETLKRTPWSYEYEKLGQYSLITVNKYFGSWKDACISAGIQPTQGRGGWNRLENSIYLTRLSVLADDLGYKPDTRIYKMAYGEPAQIYRRWGSFGNALKEAGLDSMPQLPSPTHPRKGKKKKSTKRKLAKRRGYRPPYHPPTEQELLDDLRRVATELGHTPTCKEYKATGRFTFQLFFARFGSWTKSCQLVGLTPHTRNEGRGKAGLFFYQRASDGKVVRLAGSYEYRFANWLDERAIDWTCHGEFPPVLYIGDDGKSHRYLPDFYVPIWNLYIDVKCWFPKKDRAKIAKVRESNPDYPLAIYTRRIMKAMGAIEF